MTTPDPVRADGLWLDDLEVGQTFRSQEYDLTRDAIVAFASDFDPQPFHLDEVAAAGTFFGGLVASGWHTAAITMRLQVTSGLPVATGIVGGGGEVTWPSAAIAGDVLRVKSRIAEIRPSASRPGRATVVVESETVNRDGDVRQRLIARLLVWARPPG